MFETNDLAQLLPQTEFGIGDELHAVIKHCRLCRFQYKTPNRDKIPTGQWFSKDLRSQT